MTLPGRFFLQKFLRDAVDAACDCAVVEMTSEGAKQYRHRFIEIDALVFTNLSPEHIESHGSFQKYKEAKLEIAEQLAASGKQPRYIVANTDDEHGKDFLAVDVEEKLPYNLSSLKLHTLHRDGVGLIFNDNAEEISIRVPLVGLFNVYNALAAITLTRALGVSFQTIEKALRALPPVKGRVEHFQTPSESPKHVTAIVDYAHTPDSLEKLYIAFKDQPKSAYSVTLEVVVTRGSVLKWRTSQSNIVIILFSPMKTLTTKIRGRSWRRWQMALKKKVSSTSSWIGVRQLLQHCKKLLTVDMFSLLAKELIRISWGHITHDKSGATQRLCRKNF